MVSSSTHLGPSPQAATHQPAVAVPPPDVALERVLVVKHPGCLGGLGSGSQEAEGQQHSSLHAAVGQGGLGQRRLHEHIVDGRQAGYEFCGRKLITKKGTRSCPFTRGFVVAAASGGARPAERHRPQGGVAPTPERNGAHNAPQSGRLWGALMSRRQHRRQHAQVTAGGTWRWPVPAGAGRCSPRSLPSLLLFLLARQLGLGCARRPRAERQVGCLSPPDAVGVCTAMWETL